LLVAAALLAVVGIAFGTASPTYEYSQPRHFETEHATGQRAEWHAAPNHVSGPASAGFAVAAGLALVAAALSDRRPL
jgi:hypothetical protein